MTTRLRRCLAATVLLLLSFGAQAAITCSVSSSGFAVAYNPTLATPTIAQTSFTVTCNRALSTDPMSVSYTNAAGNGQNSLGINNRAVLNGNYLRYDVYVDGGCATQWKGASTIASSISFATTGPVSKVHNFWGCVAAGQSGLPAGTYVDAVTMTLSYGPNPQSSATAQFPVNIATPATCSMSAAPGAVNFGSYVAFGAALSASTTFGATCTNYLPYTVALTPSSGSIAALAYTLLLTPPVGMSGTTLSATGSGFQQNYSINGSMAGGQPGACAGPSCSGSAAHTLTLTY